MQDLQVVVLNIVSDRTSQAFRQ